MILSSRSINVAYLLSTSLCLCVAFVRPDFGQTAVAKDEIKPPEQETFSATDEILVPWRDSVCSASASIDETGCRPPHYSVYIQAHRLTLYDKDGSEWLRFSLSNEEPDFIMNVDKKLIPLGVYPEVSPYLLLRLVGESKNWYKVEVNGDTRETKYALRHDTIWAKTSWRTWLNRSYNIYPDQEKNKLRDKPNGEIIKEATELPLHWYRFLEMDGDWVKVDCMVANSKDKYAGWIRWRDGRKILVGWLGNWYKTPSVEESKQIKNKYP